MANKYEGWNENAKDLMNELDRAAEVAKAPVDDIIGRLSDDDLKYLNKSADAERRKRASPGETASRERREQIATMSTVDIDAEWTKLR